MLAKGKIKEQRAKMKEERAKMKEQRGKRETGISYLSSLLFHLYSVLSSHPFTPRSNALRFASTTASPFLANTVATASRSCSVLTMPIY